MTTILAEMRAEVAKTTHTRITTSRTYTACGFSSTIHSAKFAAKGEQPTCAMCLARIAEKAPYIKES